MCLEQAKEVAFLRQQPLEPLKQLLIPLTPGPHALENRQTYGNENGDLSAAQKW